MFPVEWNAGTNYLHIALALVPQRLARAEGDAMLIFQYHLLLK
jgi:hypothetical protein